MAASPREMLASLRKRREFIRAELSALDSLISTYEVALSVDASEFQKDEDQFELYKGKSSRAAQTAAIAESIEAVRKIVLKAGKPMKRGELVSELEKMGYDLPGQDKNKVLGTNLWRSGKFRSVPKKGYWPKDVPLRHD